MFEVILKKKWHKSINSSSHVHVTVSLQERMPSLELYAVVWAILSAVASHAFKNELSTYPPRVSQCTTDCDSHLHHCDLTCTINFGKYNVRGFFDYVFRTCLVGCAYNYMNCLMCLYSDQISLVKTFDYYLQEMYVLSMHVFFVVLVKLFYNWYIDVLLKDGDKSYGHGPVYDHFFQRIVQWNYHYSS